MYTSTIHINDRPERDIRQRTGTPGSLFLALALASVSPATGALEILELSVTGSNNEYRIRILAALDALEENVYSVITDYANANRINPNITSIEVLGAYTDNAVRVQHRSVHRIGPFSFDVDWGGDITETGQGRLHITTIPEISSFDSGSASWEIFTHDGRTHVLHESRMKPAFCIPPLVGSYLMKKHMRKETIATFSRIEQYARNVRVSEDAGFAEVTTPEAQADMDPARPGEHFASLSEPGR
jgi:hypothetical protein